MKFLPFYMHIFSLWQQAGRAGRREKPSLAVYVAFGGPLDQYFMNHPKKLFGSPIECCHIDSQNQQVLSFLSLLYFTYLSILSGLTNWQNLMFFFCCLIHCRFLNSIWSALLMNTHYVCFMMRNILALV